jgi:hypothetical protein
MRCWMIPTLKNLGVMLGGIALLTVVLSIFVAIMLRDLPIIALLMIFSFSLIIVVVGVGSEAEWTDHDWTEWSYERPADCAQTRTCRRCGKLDRKIEHQQRIKQYMAETGCAVLWVCPRCGYAFGASFIEHRWSDWSYTSPSSCEQVQICIRCGEKREETLREYHLWEWSYTQPGSCHQVRTCTRCSEYEERAEHPWCGWQHDDARHWRSCTRCGRNEEGWHELETSMGEGHGGSDHWFSSETTACDICGYVESYRSWMD